MQLVDNVPATRKIGNVPPNYPNGWFVILESSEVGESQMKHVSALGENFAVSRTAEGKITVLGTNNLRSKASVDVNGNVIAEPAESSDGVAKFTVNEQSTKMPPASAENSAVDDANQSRRVWKSCEVNRLILVWYHVEGEEPTWEPQPAEQLVNENWYFAGCFEKTALCHVQDIIENTADPHHFTRVHGSGLEKYLTHWQPDPKELHKAIFRIRVEIRFFNKLILSVSNGTFMQEGPGYNGGLLKLLGLRFLVSSSFTPVAPLVTRIKTRYYCMPGSFSIIIARLLHIRLSSMGVDQDMPIWNNKMHLDNPILVKEDAQILHFRRWFSNFYTSNSPRYGALKNTPICQV